MYTNIPPVQSSFEASLNKSWFHRNWKWVVPSLLVALIACFILGVFSLVFYSFHHSDVFRITMEKARQNPVVTHALGPDIKPGLLVMGSIQMQGSGGWANLAIPVSGEHGKGKVFIEARRRERRWWPSLIVFENAATGERTNLLPQSDPALPEH